MEHVEREVTIPADLDESWRLVSDPDELATWLGVEVQMDDAGVVPGARAEVVDDDGTRRTLIVDDVRPGRSISWHWRIHDDASPDAHDETNPDAGRGGTAHPPSHVEITLLPVAGGTRVTVIERAAVLRAAAPSGGRGGMAMTSRWGHRLLHLELRALLLDRRVLSV